MIKKCWYAKDSVPMKNEETKNNEKKIRKLISSVPGLKEGLMITGIMLTLPLCQINETGRSNKSSRPYVVQSAVAEKKPQPSLILHEGMLKELVLLMKEGSSASFRLTERTQTAIFLKIVSISEEGVDIALGTEILGEKPARQIVRVSYGEAELGNNPIKKLAVKKESDGEVTIRIFLNTSFKPQ